MCVVSKFCLAMFISAVCGQDHSMNSFQIETNIQLFSCLLLGIFLWVKSTTDLGIRSAAVGVILAWVMLLKINTGIFTVEMFNEYELYYYLCVTIFGILFMSALLHILDGISTIPIIFYIVTMTILTMCLPVPSTR